MELLARLGYGARGVVYLLVGMIAIAASLGAAREAADSRGALHEILDAPFGEVLLSLVAAGLVAYSLWRLVQSVLDTDRHGVEPRGLAVRAGLFVSAILHLGLAFFAVSLVLGWGTGGDGDDASRSWTAWLFAWPFGRWVVGAIGLAVIGAGLAHVYKGAVAGFEKYLDLDPARLRWVSPTCRFGLIARGVVFTIIGSFFVVAAVKFASSEARGLKGALSTLEAQPYGPWILRLTGCGLLAFGVYSLIEARWRRIDAFD